MAKGELSNKAPPKNTKVNAHSKQIKKGPKEESKSPPFSQDKSTAESGPEGSPKANSTLGAPIRIIPAQVIQKKRDGIELTGAEIVGFINGFTSENTVSESQMAALAMAVCFQGMTFEESMFLTRSMVESGKVLQWKKGKFLVDKHSTGGQGDKTSLILAPLMACCGVRVPMVSGRGLGPTGGTLDKLESIPGFRVGLSLNEITTFTDEIGFVIAA